MARTAQHAFGGVGVLLLLSFATPAVLAQPPPKTDVAGAEVLFEEARALMEAGKQMEVACAKFAESQHLAPAAGTLLNLGICYDKLGKTASAWAAFREAIGLSSRTSQKAREEYARELARALEPRLIRLVINVSPAAASTSGLEVRRDGIVITSAEWGTPIPVDPGTHVVEAAAPNKNPFRTTVEARTEGSRTTANVPALVDAPREQQPSFATQPVIAQDTAGNKTLQIAGLATAGVGVVMLGVGTFFGLRASSESSDLEDQASTRSATWGPDQSSAYDSGDSAATMANIFLVTGAVVLVAGGVMTVLGWPSSKKTTNAMLRW